MVRDAARAFTDALPGHVDVPVQIATGPVVDAIDAAVEQAGAGLLVVGASRRFRHLGSTTARLLRRAPCAVLVLPHDAVATRPLDADVAA